MFTLLMDYCLFYFILCLCSRIFMSIFFMFIKLFYCQNIDTAGEVRLRRMSVNMVHHLPANERVELVHFTRTGQPLKDAGCLFNRFCLSIGRQTQRFPIDPLDWRLVPDPLNLAAWETVKVIEGIS